MPKTDECHLRFKNLNIRVRCLELFESKTWPSVGAVLAAPVAGPSGSCRKDRSYNKHRAHAVL